MLLLIETWSAACCWFSSCTSCSMVRPDSASRCSIQVSGSASAALCPCSRRASSATNALVIGGSDRAMSAITRIRLFGSLLGHLRHLVGPGLGQVAIGCAAATMRTPTRRRFSISASRSMIGMAHSSPSFSGVTVW